MAVSIRIKINGFMFPSAFIAMELIQERSWQLKTPLREPRHKKRSGIKQYGLSNASRQQSGRHWNKVSWQLKDISSEGLNRCIQRIDGWFSVALMIHLHGCKRLKDFTLACLAPRAIKKYDPAQGYHTEPRRSVPSPDCHCVISAVRVNGTEKIERLKSCFYMINPHYS